MDGGGVDDELMAVLPFQAVESVLVPHLSTYWPHLEAVMEDSSRANALTRADACKVHGAMLVSPELCNSSLTRPQACLC